MLIFVDLSECQANFRRGPISVLNHKGEQFADFLELSVDNKIDVLRRLGRHGEDAQR